MMFGVDQAIEERCPFSQTGLVVSYIIYDESRNVHASGNTAEIGATAVYWVSFTPNNEGDWTAYFYCVATGERHTFHYPVYGADDSLSATHNIEVAHGTAIQTIITIANTNIYSLSFFMDVNTLIVAVEGGTVTLTLENKIDAVNYRTVAEWTFDVGGDNEHPNVEYAQLHHNSRIRITLSTAVAAQRSCPFRLILHERGG